MGRPSDERREILKKRDCASVYILNNLVPLERYYAIADTLLLKFEEANDKNDLDNAYVMGKRLYKFCAEVLPSHDYYMSSQKELLELRVKNLQSLSDVADKLELIVELMDLEEVERQENETRMKLQRLEEQKRRQLEEREAVLERHKSFRQQKKGKSSAASCGVEGDVSKSAQLKLQQLALQPKGTHKPQVPPPPLSSKSTIGTTTNQNQVNDAPQNIRSALSDDAPSSSSFLTAPIGISSDMPIVTPPPDDDDDVQNDQHPPSYHQVVRNSSNAHLLSPLIEHHDNEAAGKNQSMKQKPSPEDNLVPIKELTSIYTQEYDALKTCKEVEVFSLSTYQGRLSSHNHDSTNGCAVISPLVAITYLNSGSPGLTDTAIESVIDNQAPPILSRVRSKLGLPGHALIVPSDVHDYLVDAKILRQSMFVGVCGGNLLNPEHVEVLLSMLRTGRDCENNGDDDGGKEEKKQMEENSGKKIAAALFFHEHVVSILKLTHTHGEDWYDLIDSLPTASFQDKRDSQRYGRAGSSSSSSSSLGATRTRCKDIRSLESTLRWYACHKFTANDQKYIDANVWHEELCDFDPRVFQAFVWIEQPVRNGLCV